MTVGKGICKDIHMLVSKLIVMTLSGSKDTFCFKWWCYKLYELQIKYNNGSNYKIGVHCNVERHIRFPLGENFHLKPSNGSKNMWPYRDILRQWWCHSSGKRAKVTLALKVYSKTISSYLRDHIEVMWKYSNSDQK